MKGNNINQTHQTQLTYVQTPKRDELSKRWTNGMTILLFTVVLERQIRYFAFGGIRGPVVKPQTSL